MVNLDSIVQAKGVFDMTILVIGLAVFGIILIVAGVVIKGKNDKTADQPQPPPKTFGTRRIVMITIGSFLLLVSIITGFVAWKSPSARRIAGVW